jgi:hypothetical protein
MSSTLKPVVQKSALAKLPFRLVLPMTVAADADAAKLPQSKAVRRGMCCVFINVIR